MNLNRPWSVQVPSLPLTLPFKLPEKLRPNAISLLLAAGVGVGFLVVGRTVQTRPAPPPPPPAQAPLPTVTALGRLAPVSEVRTIAAPSSTTGQQTILRLLVEEGDAVRQGQLLAVLDGQPRLQAALDRAEAQVNLARTRLAIARADHRSGLGGQLAKVQSLQAQLRTAQAESRRYDSLYAKGALSASDRDTKDLTRDTVAAALRDAEAQLARQRAAEGGTSLDVEAAERSLVDAEAALRAARAERDQSLVRSPIDGRVLSVQSRAGEVPGAAGIVEIGQTDRMEVIAEVYQSDLPRVRVGQPVRITSTALKTPLEAKVGLVGAIVRRQSVINTDPSANTDSRVVEVRAPLTAASNGRAAGLSNLQVRAVIGP
jgi:HlyD family secretion protein